MSLREQGRALWREWTRDEEPSPDATTVALRHRIWTAIAVGLASGIFCWFCSLRPGAVPDFTHPYTAARIFLEGQNPYLVMGGGADATENTRLFYPFTAILAAIPLARLPLGVAAAIFVGISAALLAFFITRDGLWRVHIFASSPFVVAALLGQYTPLVMVMAFLPATGFLATLKPNIGIALFLRRPSFSAVVGAVVLVGASLLIFPAWPMDWLHQLRSEATTSTVHVMPVREFGGLLLLLAIVSWRRTTGRLLLAMSLVPQGLFFYDALPLWLIPRTRKQSIFLTACSQLAIFSWYLLLPDGQDIVRGAAPHEVWLIYIPALLVVMWQWRQERGAAEA